MKHIPFGKGTPAGCGVIYGDESIEGTFFFTKDGEILKANFKEVKGRLYPAVGMTEETRCEVNRGVDAGGRSFRWRLANGKKEWVLGVAKSEVEGEGDGGGAEE